MTIARLPFALTAAAMLLGACAHHAGVAVCADGVKVPAWRGAITPGDFDRLRQLRTSFADALTKAKAGGASARIAAEGELLDPDRSLPDPLPPPGAYRCRTVKLGAHGPATHDFTAYPAMSCSIVQDGDAERFEVTAGSQRPVGLFYPDGSARAVFLGTLELGDELTPIRYGLDTQRDMVGALDRIGAHRWRLSLPAPHFESLYDVIEITPAG
ncbi:MAG: DUF4893 domain-containing protein [Pseudomonadota bacterium]|nr:DUF4893 domain-containing protein [Pseudomonadota bacterium]